jgi:hypothetical protein
MPKTTHTDTVSWLGGEAQSRVEGDMTETVVQYFPALTLANTGMIRPYAINAVLSCESYRYYAMTWTNSIDVAGASATCTANAEPL